MEKIIKALKSRNMNGYFVNNKEEALQKALGLIEKDKKICFGGSATLQQMGILDKLRKDKYKLIEREDISSFYTKHFLLKNASTDGIYLSGTNAITEDGKIINIDGWGNRVNAINYGPEKVIVVVGKNKVVKNIDEGIKRISEKAAPPNTKRLNHNTPCAKTGKCEDCRSQERICNILSIVQFQRDPNRIHVIIVNEELGY